MDHITTPPKNETKSWFGESVLLKLGLIAILTVILLLPSNWITVLIAERQNRQDEVIKEISDKWSGSQFLQGPVLILPYKTIVSMKDSTGKSSFKEQLTNIYILPEMLNITSKVDPEILHRGIFDAVVYNTKLNVNGKFSPLELKKSGTNPAMVQWDKAKIAIGITDLKGLKNNPEIKLSNQKYAVEPDFAPVRLFANTLVILPDLSAEKNSAQPFSFELNLRGSTELGFQHLGKSTVVSVEGKWNNPSFTGRYLPEQRKITANSFSATWKMTYFNRLFPQQWIAEHAVLSAETQKDSFGVRFLLPVDQYQKTMRSAKYAILVILLTFMSLFFTELLQKKKIHLLQYILIGAAMIIYYTLLLSFSEQFGFDLAYLIASAATVVLIGSFIGMLLKNRKPALVFAGILSIFYCFIYIIIQLQDLSLIFGSIGLFITIAVLMYLSAKIDWTKK